MVRQAMARDSKWDLQAANLAVFDTTLQRDYSEDWLFYYPIVALKSALLVSKVYLPDIQFCDHRVTWSLYPNEGFQSLLHNDFDGRPAILVGLRRGCETPIEAMNEMIRKGMIFSSASHRPDVQAMVDSRKMQDARQFFSKMDPTGETYLSFEKLSNDLVDRGSLLWRAEIQPGRYFDVVKSLTSEICCLKSNEVDHSFQSLARKFEKQLVQSKREEYDRGKAEHDLWEITHGKKPIGIPVFVRGETDQDFRRLVIDFAYNTAISITNPRGIMWHGNPYDSRIGGRFGGLLKKGGLTPENLEQKELNPKILRMFKWLLRRIDFDFIYELRTAHRKDFESGISKISKAGTEDDIMKATSEHLKFVFDRLIEHPCCGKVPPKGYDASIWGKLERFNGPRVLIEESLTLGGMMLYLLLRANLPFPAPILVEALIDLGMIAGLPLATIGLAQRAFQNRLKYPGKLRLAKEMFTNKLIKEITTPEN